MVNPTHTSESTGEAASGIAAAATGIGVLIVALFPLAVPFLLLTAAFLAPLVLVPIAAAILLAIIAGAVVAIRALGRLLAYARPARRQASGVTPWAAES